MKTQRTITQARYDAITARIKALKKLSKPELTSIANWRSPINSIDRTTSKNDLAYFVLNLEYGRSILEAYDAKLIAG